MLRRAAGSRGSGLQQRHRDFGYGSLSYRQCQRFDITAAGPICFLDTNGASNNQVEYGIDTGYGLIATQPSDSTGSYTFVLNNLAAATNYHFRVRSGLAV